MLRLRFGIHEDESLLDSNAAIIDTAVDELATRRRQGTGKRIKESDEEMEDLIEHTARKWSPPYKIGER